MQSLTAAEMMSNHIGTHHLSFGCPIIDQVFGGKGLHSGITEISGEAGAGKTQVCLQLSLQCALSEEQGGLSGATAYMCCGEGEFPIKRLVQLCRSNRYHSTTKSCGEGSITLKSSEVEGESEADASAQLLQNIHIEQCRNSEEAMESLLRVIPKMCQDQNVRLLIVDSVAGLVRTEFDTNSVNKMMIRTNLLFSIASQLKRLCDTYNLCVVVVNQVTATGFESDNLFLRGSTSSGQLPSTNVAPALGLAWSHCVNSRVMLHRDSHWARIIPHIYSDHQSISQFPVEGNVVSDSDGHFVGLDDGIQAQKGIASNDQYILEEEEIPHLRSKRSLRLIYSPLYPPNSASFEITIGGVRGLSMN